MILSGINSNKIFIDVITESSAFSQTKIQIIIRSLGLDIIVNWFFYRYCFLRNWGDILLWPGNTQKKSDLLS